jgi:uncharacterized protein (DUF1786 family)
VAPATGSAGAAGRPLTRCAAVTSATEALSDRRILTIDVGAGTMDILLTVPGEPLENAVKLVVPSRTRVVADMIGRATSRSAAVVFYGPVMGGGACTAAMKRHLAAGLRFVAGESAALSFADDLAWVRALGVEVVPDAEAAGLATGGGDTSTSCVTSGDLDPQGLHEALAALGVSAVYDAVGIAVQDHGFTPDGSNRISRFRLWEQAVREGRRVVDLFYAPADVPANLTRMRAAAMLAGKLAGEVVAADTGPAALVGALPANEPDAVLINVGNSHAIVAVAVGGRLAGVFEHHTGLLDGPGLEKRLRRFLRGELGNAEVREEGGHGAVLAAPPPADLPLIVTGPRRGLLGGSSLPLEFAAPHGDMMLTGCFGLLAAILGR